MAIFISLFILGSPTMADSEKSELSEAMSQIETSFESLKADIRDDNSRSENISRLDTLISAGEKAVELEPPHAAEMEEAERERFIARYRSALQDMLSDARELRSLVESGAPAEQRYDQLIKVFSHQERGHQRFQDKEE
jgi:hypothetical protein